MVYLLPLLEGLVNDKKYLRALTALDSDEKIYKELLKLGKTADEIGKAFDRYYGTKFIDLDATDIDSEILREFNLASLKAQGILPFKLINSAYHFAISDLFRQGLKEGIAALCKNQGKSAVFYFAFDWQIKKKLNELETGTTRTPAPTGDTVRTGGDSNVEWVDRLISKGILLRASDIHFEPREGFLQIRYRVDGILAVTDTYPIDDATLSNITTRIKIISNMDIAEKRKPQDGRINNFVHEGNKYDIRVSSTSTAYGEKIVMRIFNKDSTILTFKELGFSEDDEKKVRSMLQSRQGIIYLAGATGSGKTTTLYTMIDALDGSKLNIYTIEDPIERTLKNVNQIQIEPQAGITYASTLRALLRQDPDVIAVGEVRDLETADLAVRSSLTGHLVLTTIHANNALETINRLYNMGLEPYLVSASALGFMSQRLARVLCPHCKTEAKLTPAERAWLETMREKYGTRIQETTFYKAAGCERCNHLGFKGRTALTEILVMSDNIRYLIAKREYTNTIYRTAIEEGFVPIELAGYYKAATGITSIDEVIRIL